MVTPISRGSPLIALDTVQDITRRSSLYEGRFPVARIGVAPLDPGHHAGLDNGMEARKRVVEPSAAPMAGNLWRRVRPMRCRADRSVQGSRQGEAELAQQAVVLRLAGEQAEQRQHRLACRFVLPLRRAA